MAVAVAAVLVVVAVVGRGWWCVAVGDGCWWWVVVIGGGRWRWVVPVLVVVITVTETVTYRNPNPILNSRHRRVNVVSSSSQSSTWSSLWLSSLGCRSRGGHRRRHGRSRCNGSGTARRKIKHTRRTCSSSLTRGSSCSNCCSTLTSSSSSGPG